MEKTKARLALKWYEFGTETTGSCPPIQIYRADLGVGTDGHMWIAQSEFRPQEKKFLVSFDYETKERSAFLRDEVIDADDYWKAHRVYYHSRLVNYEDIQHVVRDFIIGRGIGDVKDVTGKAVV